MAEESGREIIRAEVARLQLDPDNPRLPRTIDRTSESEILRWMLEDATLVDLMQSIAVQGYFEAEPLLVQGPPGDREPLVVIEGNRRLAAVMLLNNPDLAPVRRVAVRSVVESAKYFPDRLPVIRFEARDDMLDYLGYRHVTGISAWDTLAKARYVEQLMVRAAKQGEADPLPAIVHKLGSTAGYLKGLLAALKVYEHVVEKDFYGLKGVNEDTIKFAYLTTALSYESLARFAGMEGRNDIRNDFNDKQLKELIDWTFRPLEPDRRTKVGDSRHLRALAAVVDKPVAVSALRDGATLEDATAFTDEPHEDFQRLLRKSKTNLELAQRQVHRLGEPAPIDLELSQEIGVMAGDIHTLLVKRQQDQRPTDASAEDRPA
jgi:hypothetical protein